MSVKDRWFFSVFFFSFLVHGYVAKISWCGRSSLFEEAGFKYRMKAEVENVQRACAVVSKRTVIQRGVAIRFHPLPSTIARFNLPDQPH